MTSAYLLDPNIVSCLVAGIIPAFGSATVAIIGSQSAKTTVKGECVASTRARRSTSTNAITVDTRGSLLTAVVHSAGIQEIAWGACAVLIRLFRRFDRLTKVFADDGYTGTLIGMGKRDVQLPCGSRQTQ
jgi:hypothetical protein